MSNNLFPPRTPIEDALGVLAGLMANAKILRKDLEGVELGEKEFLDNPSYFANLLSLAGGLERVAKVIKQFSKP